MEHRWIKWDTQREGETRSRGAHGEKNTYRQSMGVTYRPLPESVSSRHRNNIGRDGWELGRRLGRRMGIREGAGRQSSRLRRWREEPGRRQEKPSRTQATAIKATHGGADRWRRHGGGRADDSRGPTDGGRASGGRARGGDEEPMSQCNGEDPEGQGRADGSGDRGGGGDLAGHGGAGETEDRGEAKGMEEHDGAGGTRCSQRSGVPRWRMVNDRPRRSRRDEGARRNQWTDGPQRRRER